MTIGMEKLIRKVVERSTNGECSLSHDEYADGCNPLNCELYDGMPLGKDWMFKSATDDESRQILLPFISNKLDIGFELACQIARLLSEKGFVVKEELADFVTRVDWSLYGSPELALAGLPHIKRGDAVTIRLLDVVPEDSRDGIFFACWKSKSRAVQEKLLGKFESWTTAPDWGSGSGEHAWLKYFLGKWISEETFPYERLKNLVVWHFRNEHRFL